MFTLGLLGPKNSESALKGGYALALPKVMLRWQRYHQLLC